MEALGPYTLYGRIGSGGMATVHLARAGDAEDWLALKRIHAHLADRPNVQRMFLNEAKLLAQLDHPGICGVLDYSVDDDTPYLVMRYLHGVSLSAFITQLLASSRAVPIDLMAYVAATVCEGLHYAHEASTPNGHPFELVHRDISPQNIFVTFDGRVHLLDFGVAKAAGFESLSRTGRVKGKYAYMSPEQLGSTPVDRRADIFSLGIVLWESLTGRHLFKRKNDIDTLRAVKTGAVPAPSELNPEVPQQLDAVVARSLVADRRRRFQTAEQLGAAIWRYLTAVQTPAGADELAETLAAVFPQPPTPEERARGERMPFPGWTDPRVELVQGDPTARQPGPAPKAPISQPSRDDHTLAEPFGHYDRTDDDAFQAFSGREAQDTEAPLGPTDAAEHDLPAAPATEIVISEPKTVPAAGIAMDRSAEAAVPPSLTQRPRLRPHPDDEPPGGQRRLVSPVQSTLTEAFDTAVQAEQATRLPPQTLAPEPPRVPFAVWLGMTVAAGALAFAVVLAVMALTAG